MSEYAITLTSCPPLEEVVLALGNELTTPERRALTEHLRHCEICRASIGDVEGALTVVAVATARETATSLDFSLDAAAARRERFMRRLDEARRQHESRCSLTRRWPPVAAAIVLIVVGFMFRPQMVLSADGLKNELQRVAQAVQRTLGFADDGTPGAVKRTSRISQTLEPALKALVPAPKAFVPAAKIFVPDLSGLRDACAAARPSQSAIALQGGLASFVKRTFAADCAEGQTFMLDLASRAASVTCRLNQLRTFERPGSATRNGDGQVVFQSGKRDARALAVYKALRNDLDDVDARFGVIFGSKARIFPSSRLPADFRDRASKALVYSTRLERLIDELLVHDDVWPPDGGSDVRKHPMFAKIDPTFTALWDTVYRRP